MAVKTRTIDSLASMGYQGTIQDFRTGLIEIKAEHFAEWSIDELILTRDEAADYCGHVRKRFKCPKLTRVAILRALVNVRKNGKVKK